MKRAFLSLALIAGIAVETLTPPLGVINSAVADVGRCHATAGASGSFVAVGMTCTTERSIIDSSPMAGSPSDSQAPFVEYQWVSMCMTAGPGGDPGAEADCRAAHVCPSPRQRLYRLWGRPEGGGWRPLGTRCFGAPPTAADTPRPRITPALVLNEIQRVGLPRLEARTQPEGKTLVNFDTIFYTEPRAFSETVILLGRRVEIVAEPIEYLWHHGDGGTTRTTGPGAPYPSKDITHRYTHAHATVRPRVDVTYTARFRVNGGHWQDIPETVTVEGPETTLQVSEAAPVLSGDYS